MSVVKKVCFGLSVVGVMAAGAAQAAESPWRSLQVGAFGGGQIVTRNWELGSHAHEGGLLPTSAGQFGLRVGVALPFRLAAEAELGYLPISSNADGLNHALHYDLNVTHRFFDGRWSPVDEAGFGAYHALSGDLGSDFDPRLHIGAGVRAVVNDRIAVRIDLRDVFSDGFDKLGANNIEALVGVDFLAWSPKSHPAEAQTKGAK